MIHGGDLDRLQKYPGQPDIKLTQRYAHHSPGDTKAEVKRFGAPKAADGHTDGSDGRKSGTIGPWSHLMKAVTD